MAEASESKSVYGRIYGLVDPRTGEVRYVGQTTQDLRDRLQQRLRSACVLLG